MELYFNFKNKIKFMYNFTFYDGSYLLPTRLAWVKLFWPFQKMTTPNSNVSGWVYPLEGLSEGQSPTPEVGSTLWWQVGCEASPGRDVVFSTCLPWLPAGESFTVFLQRLPCFGDSVFDLSTWTKDQSSPESSQITTVGLVLLRQPASCTEQLPDSQPSQREEGHCWASQLVPYVNLIYCVVHIRSIFLFFQKMLTVTHTSLLFSKSRFLQKALLIN